MRKQLKRSYRISKYVVYKETLIDYKEKLWSFLGSFLGIGIIAIIQSFILEDQDNIFLIGSFGASSVLIYGVIQSPLAQPRNLIGGHVVSAVVGVTVAQLVPDLISITAPLAVSLSILGMQFTKTLHPPGGATALIAVSGSEQIKSMGYLYVVYPVMAGVTILLLVALLVNNMTSQRVYPNDGRFSRTFNWFLNPVRKQSIQIKRGRRLRRLKRSKR